MLSCCEISMIKEKKKVISKTGLSSPLIKSYIFVELSTSILFLRG